jgi:hypothetical protein
MRDAPGHQARDGPPKVIGLARSRCCAGVVAGRQVSAVAPSSAIVAVLLIVTSAGTLLLPDGKSRRRMRLPLVNGKGVQGISTAPLGPRELGRRGLILNAVAGGDP